MRLPARVFLASLLVSAAAKAAPLTIMAEDASEPFSRHDGTGYANDLVRAAFKAAGVEVRLDVVPYARCKKNLEDGATPACFSMSWLPEFKGRILFADQPLFDVYADVFAGRKRKISGAGDLRAGDTLGIVNGYEYPDAVWALANRGVVLQENVNEAANLKMLAAGRLDAAVVMTSEFENVPRRLKMAGVDGSVAFAFRSGLMKSHIGFNPSNPVGEQARRAFNKGYAVILANHQRDRIRDRWLRLVRQEKAAP